MAVEATKGEIERCYQLGEVGQRCSNDVFLDNMNEGSVNYDATFQEFRQIAQTCNIVLPEKLPEECNERHKAIEDLVNDVADRFEDKKHLKVAVLAGVLLESLRFGLNMCIFDGIHNDDKKSVRMQVRAIASLLQNMAEECDVDIDRELRIITRYETELQDPTDVRRLQLEMKRKFCNLPTKEKRSEVDPTRIINDQYWVISLVRLPDRRNKQHAFLVLEAKTGNTSKIWFIDFVAAKKTDLLLSGIRDGKVRIWSFPPEEAAGSSSNLLFQCPKRLMDVRENERLLYMSWSISRTSAEVFLKNVKEKRKKPPKYNVLGDTMLADGSALSSSEEIGHNCFSFARKMLLDLNDPYIKIPTDILGEWIYLATSRFLVDQQFERHKCQMSRLAMLLAFLAGLVVILSCIIFRLRRRPGKH